MLERRLLYTSRDSRHDTTLQTESDCIYLNPVAVNRATQNRLFTRVQETQVAEPSTNQAEHITRAPNMSRTHLSRGIDRCGQQSKDPPHSASPRHGPLCSHSRLATTHSMNHFLHKRANGRGCHAQVPRGTTVEFGESVGWTSKALLDMRSS